VLRELIRELAAYERLQFSATEAALLRDGFEASAKFRALIAEWGGEPAGYALFFAHYSTFLSRAGIFLEDIFVRSSFRDKGIGRALLSRVAAIAQEEGAYGIRWDVLDWNQPAIDFYRKLGANFMNEWKTVCLSGDALQRLASEAK
jgi:GNAT superfamily N-acetyltransferase